MTEGYHMLGRICLLTALSALFAVGAQAPARAQMGGTSTAGTSSVPTFNLTPYLWLPTIDSTIKYPVRGGGTASDTLSATPGDWIPKLNIGVLLSGEVRYERFSLLTDIMYLNVGTTVGRIRSFDQGATRIPVDRTLTTSLSTRLGTTIWTFGGGYTVAEGTWGNIDLLAGFRLLSAHDTTNYSLALEIVRPDHSVALGRTGGLSADSTFVNGIGGVRGRFNLASQDWFGGGQIYLPFYFDVGAGGSNLTWQAFGGLGYQTKQVGISLGYRFLTFQQSSSSVVQRLSLGGPIITATFSF